MAMVTAKTVNKVEKRANKRIARKCADVLNFTLRTIKKIQCYKSSCDTFVYFIALSTCVLSRAAKSVTRPMGFGFGAQCTLQTQTHTWKERETESERASERDRVITRRVSGIVGIVHLLRLYLIINYIANLYRILCCLPVSIPPQYKTKATKQLDKRVTVWYRCLSRLYYY